MTKVRRGMPPPPPVATDGESDTAAPLPRAPTDAVDHRAPPPDLQGGPLAPLAPRPQAPAPPDPLRARRELAAELLRVGGSAAEVDVAPVMAELIRLPTAVLRVVAHSGIEPGTERVSARHRTQVVVCRGSVTDHLHYLRGLQPPGWPAGATWDDVPGMYAPQANAVVIATVADAQRGRVVPSGAHQHGGRSLVLHEVMHAYLALTGLDAEFVAAHRKDAARLPSALRGDSLDARSEGFAEAAARYFSGDPTLFEHWPALGNYFFTRFPPNAEPRGQP